MDNRNDLVPQKFELPQSAYDSYDTTNIGGNSLIVGPPVRFRRGRYVVGRDEGDLRGATACAYSGASARQKWHDRHPVARIIEKPDEYFPRSVDEIEDLDGGPGEWQLTEFLYLRDLETGRDCTFTASSFGSGRTVETFGAWISPYCWDRKLPASFTATSWVNAAGEAVTAQPQKAVTAPSVGIDKDLNDEIPL
jgi:hypothetical protein